MYDHYTESLGYKIAGENTQSVIGIVFILKTMNSIRNVENLTYIGNF